MSAALAISPAAHAPRVSRTGNPLLKPAGGPPSLTKRHHALIRFMVHGLDQAFPRWPDLQPHTPLDVNQAADVCGLRRKNARDLFNWPIFVAEYNRAVASLRKGEHARNIHTMIATRDAEGAGKAADRKVQLQAALALEGELGGTSISITNTVGVALAPGYILDLEERDDEARTVEHER